MLGLATTPPSVRRNSRFPCVLHFSPRQSHGREAECFHRGELWKIEYFRDLPSTTLGLQRTWPRANTAGRGLPGHALPWLCLNLSSQVRRKASGGRCGTSWHSPRGGDLRADGPETQGLNQRKGSNLVTYKPVGREIYLDQKHLGNEEVKQDNYVGKLGSTHVILT